MKELIDKDLLKEELNTRIEVLTIPEFSNNPLMLGERSAYLSILSFLDTLEVKEVSSLTDTFIEKAWNWIEDNMLTSNQHDKSLLYFKQFKKYMKEE